MDSFYHFLGNLDVLAIVYKHARIPKLHLKLVFVPLPPKWNRFSVKLIQHVLAPPLSKVGDGKQVLLVDKGKEGI